MDEKWNLFHYSAYTFYYSWVSLHFLVLFMGLTILFQLIFTFIYSTFSNNFSVSAKWAVFKHTFRTKKKKKKNTGLCGNLPLEPHRQIHCHFCTMEWWNMAVGLTSMIKVSFSESFCFLFWFKLLEYTYTGNSSLSSTTGQVHCHYWGGGNASFMIMSILQIML